MEKGGGEKLQGQGMLTEMQIEANELRKELISMVADAHHYSKRIVQVAERLVALLDCPGSDNLSEELKEAYREEYKKIIEIEEASKG